jgi:hypothetical protein
MLKIGYLGAYNTQILLSRNTAMQKVALGARIVCRDAEGLVKQVDRNP